MNLETIDEFLSLKARSTIDAYFTFLSKGFDLIDPVQMEIPKEKMGELNEYFGTDKIAYQVATTTFISEIFHIVETYLKSNLLRSGIYLLYPSIDKYPEQKERLDKFNREQKTLLEKTLADFGSAVFKKKENKIEQISSVLGHQLFTDDKDLLVNSISCAEALYRLEKYVNWQIADDVKERFRLFIENRNQIIHFNKLSNLTFSAQHSLFVLLNLSTSNKEVYPLFSLLRDHTEGRLENFNILSQEILYNNHVPKVLDKIKNSINSLIPKEIKK